MKRTLIISTIILAILVGFHLLNFFSTAQNVFETTSSFSQDKNSNKELAQTLETSKLFNLSSTPLKGEENKQINILILGQGGANHPGGHLTDTILLGNINLKKNKATLFSIPRDLYVNIPDSNIWTKINAVKSYGGIDSLKNIIKEITGLSIHYWLGLDFESFVKIIDALGGLPVYVEENIYDPLFPGPNYSYEPFELSQGWHYLDGETVLKYIRSRHSPEGDFSRTKRQQQILEALRIKLNSPKSFLDINLISTILGSLGSGFETDIKFSEIGRFYTLANGVLPEFVENKIIDISDVGAIHESPLLVSQQHPTAGSILVPRAGMGNYEEIRGWVEKVLEENGK